MTLRGIWSLILGMREAGQGFRDFTCLGISALLRSEWE